MSPVEIRVEKGLSRAGFPNSSGMTGTVAPSGAVTGWVTVRNHKQGLVSGREILKSH